MPRASHVNDNIIQSRNVISDSKLNKINHKLLHHIPIVVVLFFCLFWIWYSFDGLGNNQIIRQTNHVANIMKEIGHIIAPNQPRVKNRIVVIDKINQMIQSLNQIVAILFFFLFVVWFFFGIISVLQGKW